MQAIAAWPASQPVTKDVKGSQAALPGPQAALDNPAPGNVQDTLPAKEHAQKEPQLQRADQVEQAGGDELPHGSGSAVAGGASSGPCVASPPSKVVQFPTQDKLQGWVMAEAGLSFVSAVEAAASLWESGVSSTLQLSQLPAADLGNVHGMLRHDQMLLTQALVEGGRFSSSSASAAPSQPHAPPLPPSRAPAKAALAAPAPSEADEAFTAPVKPPALASAISSSSTASSATAGSALSEAEAEAPTATQEVAVEAAQQAVAEEAVVELDITAQSSSAPAAPPRTPFVLPGHEMCGDKCLHRERDLARQRARESSHHEDDMEERRRMKAERQSEQKLGRGDTALAVACLGGDERYSMVDLLSNDKYGLHTINMTSNVDGCTPLMRCCESGGMRITKLLVQRGAGVNHHNLEGHSVLHVAMSYGHYELAHYLRSVGAKKCQQRCMKCSVWSKLLNKQQASRRAAPKGPAKPHASEVTEADQQRIRDMQTLSLDEELAKLKAEGVGTLTEGGKGGGKGKKGKGKKSKKKGKGKKRR